MDPPIAMDSDEFRIWGKKMVDYVADYWDNLRQRKPIHNVKPGYIWDLMPKEAPEEAESWEEILSDIEQIVLSANTHWHHPHFFAYYPTACSYPAIVADILAGGISSIGFTWNSSPSCTELEMVMLDWLAKMLDLPSFFLNSDPGYGAGMIQGTASEATYVAMLSVKKRAFIKYKEENSRTELGFFMSWSRIAINRLYQLVRRETTVDAGDVITHPRLVAYCSEQAHSSVEKAALMSSVIIRKLKTSKRENYALIGSTLEEAIKEDLNQGLTPFFVVATIGATSCCAIDDLKTLGPVCQQYGIWLHIDAAYAGNAAICPEYRYILDGIEMADSFNVNPHKWMMVNFDCSAMWFRDVRDVDQAFAEDSVYLKHDHQKGSVPDYKNYQIPLGRRFRSLKIWFVLRAIGVRGLQHNIRNQCKLAMEFGKLVSADRRFELVVPTTFGLGENSLSERLLKSINSDRRIHLVPATVDEIFFLRLVVCSTKTNSSDVNFAWRVIKELTDEITPKI